MQEMHMHGKECEDRFLGVKLDGVPRPQCKARCGIWGKTQPLAVAGQTIASLTAGVPLPRADR